MSWFTPDGKEIQDLGGWGGMNLIMPDGTKLTYQEAIAQGLAIPDRNSINEAKGYGYNGDTIETIAAGKSTTKEMEGYPDTQLKAPTSILDAMKGDLGQATEGADLLNKYAKSTELTPYAQKLIELNKQEELGQRGQLSQQYGTNVTQGLRTLGSTGGYDSGARERMATEASRSYMTGGQGIGANAWKGRAGIEAQDMADKMTMLKGMPAMYQNLATPIMNQRGVEQGYGYGTDKYNIDAAVKKFELQKKVQAAREESNAANPNPNAWNTGF